MSTRDDIISIKNGLITLGDVIANLSVHADDSDRLVNASKSINFAGSEKNTIYGKGLQWSGFGNTKMLNYPSKSHRLWSSKHHPSSRCLQDSIDNIHLFSRHIRSSSKKQFFENSRNIKQSSSKR